MRAWLRVGLVLVALVLLVASAALLLRVRLEASPALRDALVGAARAQLGVRFEPGEIRVCFRPGGLRLPRPVLELEDGARLALGETRIDVELASLLADRPKIRGVRVTGDARLEGPPAPARDPASVFGLAGDLELALSEVAGSPGWSLQGALRPETGGTIDLLGQVDAQGFVGEVTIEGVESAAFAPLLESGRSGTASLSGTYDGRFVRSAGEPSVLRLASSGARIRIPPLSLEGPIALVAWLPANGDGQEPGRFQIDASRARVEYADAGTQASGSGVSIGGRIVPGAGGRLRLDEVALRVERFRGELTRGGETGRPGRTDAGTRTEGDTPDER